MFKRKELAEIPNVKPIAAETKKQRAKEEKQRSKQLRRSAKQSEMNAAQSARSIKKRRAPEKAADCLQYERMYESGICEVEPGLFSMTMAFTDVNFQLARQEEQKSLFTQYSEFLNYFDPDTHLQISLVTRRVDEAEFRRDTFLPLRGNSRDRYSEEMNRVISEKALQGQNGLIREKYITITYAGICARLSDNAQEQKYLRKTITGILRSATGMADFADKLKTAGIETKVKKSTEQVLYRSTALDGAWVPEDALGSEFTSEGIEYALKNGKMQLSDGAENSLLDRYQKLTIQYPEVCTAAVKLSSRQILSAGKNGLVLQVHDDNGNPAKLMVNKSEVTTSPDGEITFNVGNGFSYDLVYEDETHGTIRGAKLIQQIDEENHVEPVQVILSENQIKAMSIRGVTLHLPQNGIERLFIPEKYVLRDLDAGQCTVLLYPNLQYSYVPIGDSKKRLNIQGDRLSEFLGSSINPITESTGLKHKIAAVERRAGIENAKFLGKMLQGMTDSRIHTTGDYDKVIHNLGKTQIGLTNELAEVKQKRTTYATAAKHLQICKTYKPVWMEYAAKPLNQKMEYFNQHSTELQAYRNAAAYLEKESIDQSVEIDKVNVLAQEMGHRMDELVEQLRDVNLQEQKVRQERQTLAEIRSDLVE